MKTQRKPYLVLLKSEFAAAYQGRLEVGREYQALFSLYQPHHMSIVGTEVAYADKRHFIIKQPE
jgi:hypothetical protein